jgi:hypothetical protein
MSAPPSRRYAPIHLPRPWRWRQDYACCDSFPGLGAALREVTDAADEALAFGGGDHAAGVQQVEDVAGFQRLLVGGERQRLFEGEEFLADLLAVAEPALQHFGVGVFEVVGGLLLLVLEEDVAIGERILRLRIVERQVVDAVEAEHIHGEAFEAVGELARDRAHVEAADLLEVGELRDFHAVAPDFPAEAPGAKRRVLPVVLDEADVVDCGVDADLVEAFEIEILNVGRVRLQDDLVLVIVLQPVGVLAIAAILRPARGLTDRRRTTAWGRARAASWPGGACRRRLPCRRAGGSRSPWTTSRPTASG